MSYIFVDTKEKLEEIISVLLQFNGTLYCDIETTGLDFLVDKILLFQVMINGVIYIVDIRKLGYDKLTYLVDMIRTAKAKAVFHNAKFDMKFLYNRTNIMLNNVYDTMICEVILNAGIGKTLYSLEELAEKYADTFMDKESRKDFIDFPDDKEFTEKMLVYSALDVKVLEPITAQQVEQFEKTNQMAVMELDNSLLPVVAMMEFSGIKLDTESWLKLETIAKGELDKLYAEIRPEIATFVTTKKIRGVTNGLQLVDKLAIPLKGKARRATMEEIVDLPTISGWISEHFNFRSYKQKVALLNIYGVKVDSSNAKLLEGKYADNHLVQKLLRIAEVEKQISQYGSGFLKDIHPVTGKIHTEYFTVGTQTGRFSSNKPNLQNIPSAGGYRECFVPSEDYLFISCDYSQQEYRLTGAVSKEPVIINAYKNNSDMHTATAANFFSKQLSEVTKDERSWGKTRNFEIIYGTTEWGLSQSLKSSVDHALEVLNQYWAGYPRLSKFKLAIEKKIMELGFSCTPLGRRRYNAVKPTYMDSNALLRWEARVKREGFNHVVQGGGADIIKIAMVNLYNRNPFGDKFRIILQIHDELLVEAHKSIVNEAREFLEKEMQEAEQPFLGEIPAVVESKIKERWTK